MASPRSSRGQGFRGSGERPGPSVTGPRVRVRDRPARVADAQPLHFTRDLGPHLQEGAGVPSVTFEEVLDEGLCFGWSESARSKGGGTSYLQRFTPRRATGTTSKRNLEHVERLIAERRMMPAGLEALGEQQR